MQQLVTPLVDVTLLRKFISFARQNVFPVMTDDSIKYLVEFYLNLREQGKKEGSYAATHRQLEALVRLSEASARIKLKDVVEKEDTDRAIRLFKTSLQEMAMDAETGKIDIDIISSGMPHSQVTQMKKLLNWTKELSSKSENGSANVQELLDLAKNDGIDADRAQDLLKKLKQKGDLYEPRHGLLKPTQRSE